MIETATAIKCDQCSQIFSKKTDFRHLKEMNNEIIAFEKNLSVWNVVKFSQVSN